MGRNYLGMAPSFTTGDAEGCSSLGNWTYASDCGSLGPPTIDIAKEASYPDKGACHDSAGDPAIGRA